MKHSATIHIEGDFSPIATKTIDERKRICLGEVIRNFTRLQIFKNDAGDILLKPMIEIPASEAWLFKNKKALHSVKKGLQESAEGKVAKFSPPK